MTFEKPVYTARTHTTGGREGVSRSSDSHLDVRLAAPGSHMGTNPEQLLAAGWSACFLSAMQIVAHKLKIGFPADASIVAEVDLGLVNGGYVLQARLNVVLPGVPREAAEALVDGGHQTCPYSKALRGNIDVITTLRT